MRRIDTTSRFKKALSKFGAQHPELLGITERIMYRLAQDPSSQKFRAHKLKGGMRHLWSARIDYEFRITYQFTKDVIVFYNVGSHDDLY